MSKVEIARSEQTVGLFLGYSVQAFGMVLGLLVRLCRFRWRFAAMAVRKYRVNMWFFVYIAMFVFMGFILEEWIMLIPGLAFALLFGLDRDKESNRGGTEN